MRALTTLEELSAAEAFWAPLRAGPTSDLGQLGVDVRTAPPGARPHAFVVEQEGEARAGLLGRLEDDLLPLKIGYATLARIRVRRIVVEAGATVGDLSPECSELLIRALDRSLAPAGADFALVRGIPADSPLHRAAAAIPARGRRDRSPQTGLRWILHLPGSPEDLARSRSGHRKAHLRYYRNRLRRQGSQIAIRRFEGSADLARFVGDAEHVAARAYQRRIGVGFRDDAATRERLSYQVGRGWLRAWVLALDGEPAAFAMGLRDRDTYHSGDMGHDPRWRTARIGELLLECALDDLAGEGGVRRVDFGFGDETYKRRISDECRSETNVRIFAPTRRGIAIGLATNAVSRLDGVVRAALRRSGAFEAVRRRERGRIAGPPGGAR